MKNVYLDNAASTRLDERVLDAMKPFLFEVYAVATSEFGYSLGIEAREALEKARGVVAGAVGATAEEIVFTSGDTESSNLAIKGVAAAILDKARGKGGPTKPGRMVVSKIEDFPVLNSARAMERWGWDVAYLKVDAEGFVDLGDLDAALGEGAALVSVQHANQEIGTIQDIAEIARRVKERGALFHTDATHTIGRVPLDVSKIPVDLVTFSPHTLHGPKGIGALYVRKGTPLAKMTSGEYETKHGCGTITSSPGFKTALSTRYSASLTPTVIRISVSGSYSTPYRRFR